MSELKFARLKFKGDKTTTTTNGNKKRKIEDHVTTTTKDVNNNQTTEDWVIAETEDDLQGPIFILSTITNPPSVITCNERNHVALKILETNNNNNNKEEVDNKDIKARAVTNISNAEPYDISQVFVCNKIAGSTKITLKSAFGKYLATDKFGIVTCEREAAGNTEEWTIIIRPDGIAFKSWVDTFLSTEYDETLSLNHNQDNNNNNKDDDDVGKHGNADTTANNSNNSDKKKKSSSKKKEGVIRCDVDSIGFREVFTIKCQSAERAKRRLNENNGQGIKKDLTIAEMEDMKRFQSWNKGRPIVQSDVSLLKKAEKEGNLHEVLLIRREKLKSDKFCK